MICVYKLYSGHPNKALAGELARRDSARKRLDATVVELFGRDSPNPPIQNRGWITWFPIEAHYCASAWLGGKYQELGAPEEDIERCSEGAIEHLKQLKGP